jgi:hypothetical protein
VQFLHHEAPKLTRYFGCLVFYKRVSAIFASEGWYAYPVLEFFFILRDEHRVRVCCSSGVFSVFLGEVKGQTEVNKEEEGLSA